MNFPLRKGRIREKGNEEGRFDTVFRNKNPAAGLGTCCGLPAVGLDRKRVRPARDAAGGYDRGGLGGRYPAWIFVSDEGYRFAAGLAKNAAGKRFAAGSPGDGTYPGAAFGYGGRCARRTDLGAGFGTSSTVFPGERCGNGSGRYACPGGACFRSSGFFGGQLCRFAGGARFAAPAGCADQGGIGFALRNFAGRYRVGVGAENPCRYFDGGRCVPGKGV